MRASLAPEGALPNWGNWSTKMVAMAMTAQMLSMVRIIRLNIFLNLVMVLVAVDGARW